METGHLKSVRSYVSTLTGCICVSGMPLIFKFVLSVQIQKQRIQRGFYEFEFILRYPSHTALRQRHHMKLQNVDQNTNASSILGHMDVEAKMHVDLLYNNFLICKIALTVYMALHLFGC